MSRVMSSLRFADWGNVTSIINDEVDLTARIKLDTKFRSGELIELVDPEYDVFGVAVVRFIAHTTIEDFVEYGWPRHIQYNDTDEMIQSFQEYYSALSVGAGTHLYVIGFDLQYHRPLPGIAEGESNASN